MFQSRVKIRSASASRGITILEVLISIGVVAIGILGVIALLPLAGQQVRKGVIADQKAIVGRNAVQEFDLRGMRRTDQWVSWSAGSSSFVSYSPPDPASSFLIDPRFLNPQTINDSNLNLLSAAPINLPLGNRSLFPYYNPVSNALPTTSRKIQMTRITLATSPSATAAMSLLQAHRVFQTQDDLVFNQPNDRSLPPSQEFGAQNRRQFEGRISWMAMLTPKLDVRSPLASDLYSLSIIVSYNRDPTMSMNNVNERVINVRSFPGAGVNGGDVIFESMANSNKPEVAERDLDLQEGDWVMLMNHLIVDSGSPVNDIPYFRWHRIVLTDNEMTLTAPNGEWTRAATLQGPDWPASSQLRYDETQAVLMPGVVAVYEKTIRLESTSLWE